MFTGLAFLESITATPAANAGILLSTVLNVQAPFQLTVLCSCIKEVVKISFASAILRATATTSTKARCAWDSGLVIVLATEMLTSTQAGIQCPGSLLKKFQNLRLRSRDKTSSCRKKNFIWDGDKLLTYIKRGSYDYWLYSVIVYIFLEKIK